MSGRLFSASIAESHSAVWSARASLRTAAASYSLRHCRIDQRIKGVHTEQLRIASYHRCCRNFSNEISRYNSICQALCRWLQSKQKETANFTQPVAWFSLTTGQSWCVQFDNWTLLYFHVRCRLSLSTQPTSRFLHLLFHRWNVHAPVRTTIDL